MAPLCYAPQFDPFLSLDCAPRTSTLAQSKERKGSHFAIWQPCSTQKKKCRGNSLGGGQRSARSRQSSSFDSIVRQGRFYLCEKKLAAHVSKNHTRKKVRLGKQHYQGQARAACRTLVTTCTAWVFCSVASFCFKLSRMFHHLGEDTACAVAQLQSRVEHFLNSKKKCHKTLWLSRWVML